LSVLDSSVQMIPMESTVQITNSDSDMYQQLIGLARAARDGDPNATRCLAKRLNKTSVPRLLLAKINRYINGEKIIREKTAERRLSARRKSDRPKFPQTHLIFRRSRRRNGQGSQDAMYRAILCGGIETNRSRH
jgi:hypothetical protein